MILKKMKNIRNKEEKFSHYRLLLLSSQLLLKYSEKYVSFTYS